MRVKIFENQLKLEYCLLFYQDKRDVFWVCGSDAEEGHEFRDTHVIKIPLDKNTMNTLIQCIMKNKTMGMGMWRRSVLVILSLSALVWIGFAFWVGLRCL